MSHKLIDKREHDLVAIRLRRVCLLGKEGEGLTKGMRADLHDLGKPGRDAAGKEKDQAEGL